MQCAEGCSVETTWHLGKDLQVKNNKHSAFWTYGKRKNTFREGKDDGHMSKLPPIREAWVVMNHDDLWAPRYPRDVGFPIQRSRNFHLFSDVTPLAHLDAFGHIQAWSMNITLHTIYHAKIGAGIWDNVQYGKIPTYYGNLRPYYGKILFLGNLT